MIAVVDYGMGNLHSVRLAFGSLGANVLVTDRPEDLREAERIVLPGVGAFGECMKNLVSSGMSEVLNEEVLGKGKPFMGICLGMQILASVGEELGRHEGLGWIPGKVTRLRVDGQGLRVPHVGWSGAIAQRPHPVFDGLEPTSSFYYVHSYVFEPESPADAAATCDYGGPFVAAVARENLVAVQFHPEKSQRHGFALLERWMKWKP